MVPQTSMSISNDAPDTAMCVIKECEAYGLHPIQVFPGVVICHGFSEKVLKLPSSSFIQSLDERVPSVKKSDSIVPGKLQWVTGENENLNFRGKDLKRRKIWIQDGPVDKRILVYSYTGWMSPIAFATSDWNEDSHLKNVCDEYNSFATACGFEQANNAIITAYDNGKMNIGFHYDKMRSLSNDSGISVIKCGNARRFCIRKRILPKQNETASEKKDRMKAQEAMPCIFDECVPSGSLIFMSLEANFLTQHAVPASDDDPGISGSIVFRTVNQQTKYSMSVEDVENAAKKVYAMRSKRIREKAEKSADIDISCKFPKNE